MAMIGRPLIRGAAYFIDGDGWNRDSGLDNPYIDNYILRMEYVDMSEMTLERPGAAAPSKKDIARVSITGFFNIADEWDLSIEQQQKVLGNLPASTLYKWKKTPPGSISDDLVERISYIFGIYKALGIVYTEQSLAIGWLNRPNNHHWLNGMSPKARMAAGNVSDLYQVRQIIDGMRAPW